LCQCLWDDLKEVENFTKEKSHGIAACKSSVFLVGYGFEPKPSRWDRSKTFTKKKMAPKDPKKRLPKFKRWIWVFT
jgi:hypothetical protein